MVTGMEATKQEADKWAQERIEEILVLWGGTGKIDVKSVEGHPIMEVTLIIPLKKEEK